jgi:hypothetical protein
MTETTIQKILGGFAIGNCSLCGGSVRIGKFDLWRECTARCGSCGAKLKGHTLTIEMELDNKCVQGSSKLSH